MKLLLYNEDLLPESKDKRVEDITLFDFKTVVITFAAICDYCIYVDRHSGYTVFLKDKYCYSSEDMAFF